MNKMKKKLGLETIAFQNKNFGNELKLIIDNIRLDDSPYITAKKSKHILNLEDTIFKYTNLNIRVTLSENIGDTYLVFAVLNIDSGIYHENSFSYVTNLDRQNYAREISKLRGYYEVDMSTGKVGGFFSKRKSELVLEYSSLLIDRRFTSEEVTAIVLHEIGHAFTQFEYGARLVMTNQALAAISYSLLNKNPPDKHLVYVRAAADLLELPKTSLDDVVDIKDGTIVSTVIVDRAIINKVSELGTPYYDSVAVEYLADQYVARYGYGVHLASANYKSSKGLTNTSRLARTMVRLSEISAVTLGGIITSATLSTIPLVGFLLLFLVANAVISDGVSSVKEINYDSLLVRNKRIREQTIERMKDLNVPKEELAQLLHDYDAISKYIDKTKEFKSYYNKVLDLLFTTRRNANAAISLQRDLEELASNNLFATSAKLRTLY